MKTKMFLIGLACLVGVTLFAQSPGFSAWTSSGGFTGGGGGSYTVGVSNYCVGSTKSSLGQTAGCRRIWARRRWPSRCRDTVQILKSQQ